MAIEVKIKKQLGEFLLDIELKSDSRRIGILGASGCGKSMTLKSIAGIEMPDQGFISVDGRVLFDSAKKVNIKPQLRRVGYLFQNYALFPNMTVAANIAAGLRGSRRQTDQCVMKMIHKFRLDGLENRFPGQLSGGQQQRVALARIMAYEPDVILLDEPFSALDMFLKDRLQQELMEMLEDYQGTVILVSHSRDEIYRFSEELLIVDAGKSVCQGRTQEVFEKPTTKEAARLTGCKNITAVKRVNEHQLEVPGWGITVTMNQKIPEDIHYMGIRAHEFVPLSKENGDWLAGKLPVRVKSIAQLPFERKYFLESMDQKEDEICWFVQRDLWSIIDECGMPKYLGLPEEKILLLK
ncbi:MAG: sulfate/molybdate ABC transporter ATP-binding protein [Lachnospiraceae bacterium]